MNDVNPIELDFGFKGDGNEKVDFESSEEDMKVEYLEEELQDDGR